MPKQLRPNQLALTLPPSLRERLQAEAERTGESLSETIRAACHYYLAHREGITATDRKDPS